MRTLFAVALLLFHFNAQAQDQWSGKDKQMHFGASFALGVAARQLSPDNKFAAFGMAMAPGLIKEIFDSQQDGNKFSAKDMAANALGAYIGVRVGGLILRRNHVTYTMEF
jgi:putative lipoprotein